MKRALVWLVAIATTVGIVLAPPVSAQRVRAASSGAPYCGISWGSLPKSGRAHGAERLINVRAGWHDCFDRLVFEVAGRAPFYSVQYVSQVREDPSDRAVSLRGGAFLRIVFRAQTYDSSGNGYLPANRVEMVNVAGWQTFRQVAWAGSFESVVSVGLGVRARLPFRVFTLGGPAEGSRLVVDVAHSW